MHRIFMLNHIDNLLRIVFAPIHQVGRSMAQKSAANIFTHYNFIRSIYYPRIPSTDCVNVAVAEFFIGENTSIKFN